MINQLISFVAMMIPMYFQVIVIEQMVEPKEQRTTKNARILIYMIYMAIGIAIRVIVNHQPTTHMFTLIHGELGCLVYLCIFYKGAFWKKIIITLALLLGTSVSEIMLIMLIPMTDLQSMGDWDFRNVQIMFLMALGGFLSSIGIWIVTVVWKRAFFKVRTPKYAYFFCLYAFIQMFPFNKIKYLLVDGVLNPPLYYSMMTSIICGITLAFIVFYEIQKTNLQVEYKEMNEKRQLEAVHFEEVFKRRSELELITEENDRTMEKLEALLEAGQTQEAEKVIMHLLKRIEKTKEYPYSGIPVINVILTEKQKECEQNKIVLHLDINLRDELNIKQTDICSAFANILDNAIRSCKQLVEHETTDIPYIVLKAGMSRNYLIIRCENPYKEGLGRFREGSGLGLKILTDIARRYKGDFKTEKKDGVFITQLSIQDIV